MTSLEKEKAKLNTLIETFGLGHLEVQKQSERIDRLLNNLERGVRNEVVLIERGKVLSMA